tara:strand:+ start:7 stop:417 length:411 start_codon:yes stop_codon:yes gene_type:complete
MGLDYSQNKTIYYLKVVFQWILIGMVFYHSFLGMRDSDKLTFENRIKESVRWVENNHPGYRLYMINEMGIDRLNCTTNTIPNLKDLAPQYNLSHAQWGATCISILLLNSRAGCVVTAMHALFLIFVNNLYEIKPYL